MSLIQSGIVSGVYGAYYTVLSSNKNEYLLKPRGKLRLNSKVHSYQLQREKNILTVGDAVEFSLNENLDKESAKYDLQGYIHSLKERKNFISRSNYQRLQILASNIDQVFIVSSLDAPLFNPGFIDRVLVETISKNIPVVLFLNKIDFFIKNPNEEKYIDALNRFTYYQTIGIEIFLTSFIKSISEEIIRRMKNKMTFLIGQSGTGKSTFLNSIGKENIQKTCSVEEGKKGRHTTVNPVLKIISDNIMIIDSPGVREFSLSHLNKNEISSGFPEFTEKACRFSNCNHIQEIGCQIKNDVEQSLILNNRYESYRSIIESLDESYKPKRGDYWRGLR